MKYLLFILFLALSMSISAQVAINTDGSLPDNSAILDVKSTSQGFLPPRIALSAANNAAPVISPASGLLVYNTSYSGSLPNNVMPGYYYWNSMRWVPVSSPQGSTPGDMLYWNGTQWAVIPAGSEGKQLSFCNGIPVWGGCLPVVTTMPISIILAAGATTGGNITSNGGETITVRGVCWGTSPGPTIAGNRTTDGSGLGSYISNMSGMAASTIYYVRGYATISSGTYYGNELSFSTTGSSCPGLANLNYGGVTYNTIQIGTQCWLKENLNIGNRIDLTANQTNNSVIEKYCYNDLESNCDVYGGLYQWDEIMQYSTSQGAQGICPTDWHIATDAEYTILTSFLGGESVAAGKMDEAGNSHWLNNNPGRINSSLFTAIPGGVRGLDGYNWYLGYDAIFWSSTQSDVPNAWRRDLGGGVQVTRNSVTKLTGNSVRCIKN